MAVLGIVLTGGLLSSALTSDSGVTSNPESLQAQDLIDERLPGSDALDELVIVRSERLTVATPRSPRGSGGWPPSCAVIPRSAASARTWTAAARPWSHGTGTRRSCRS